MLCTEKILVLIESRDQATHLLEKTSILAAATGARVELFCCCYSLPLSSSYPFDPEARRHARQGFLHGAEKWLETQARQLEQQGIEVATDVCWERHAEQGMMTKIERYQPDMVVKDCRYHHRLDQHLLGHVDWELLRHCPVPLLLVRPQSWAGTASVIAAVDPIHSHDKPASVDMSILRMAGYCRRLLKGSLGVFHCFQPLPASVIFNDTLQLNYEQFREKLRQTHRQAMEDLLEQFGLPEEISALHLAEGEPWQQLPAWLREVGADIVVMGAIERGLSDRFFIGSTSEMALDHITCDVLVVRPPTTG